MKSADRVDNREIAHIVACSDFLDLDLTKIKRSAIRVREGSENVFRSGHNGTRLNKTVNCDTRTWLK